MTKYIKVDFGSSWKIKKWNIVSSSKEQWGGGNTGVSFSPLLHLWLLYHFKRKTAVGALWRSGAGGCKVPSLCGCFIISLNRCPHTLFWVFAAVRWKKKKSNEGAEYSVLDRIGYVVSVLMMEEEGAQVQVSYMIDALWVSGEDKFCSREQNWIKASGETETKHQRWTSAGGWVGLGSAEGFAA